MQLIGMLDSPYVRRVAISLELMGIDFEHRPLSVFRNFEAFREINRVVKAPTLVCDDGTVLMDSTLILDYLEGLVAPGRRLMPHAGFGLGFGRTVADVTGLASVRDVIPFPRTPGKARYWARLPKKKRDPKTPQGALGCRQKVPRMNIPAASSVQLGVLRRLASTPADQRRASGHIQAILTSLSEKAAPAGRVHPDSNCSIPAPAVEISRPA